ncbi:hypothetical protein Ddc_19288 [Ditylenchus destructor]|nr:hypothetical protein Ddc_19288 [Ditylenchus destructor]
MSCSKPLPPFTFDVLCYLNRDQLERFSIVCRPLKNFIERYFRSKPYRIFDRLEIRGGSYLLEHTFEEEIEYPVSYSIQWHPNRDDYSAQQFLSGQKCIIAESNFSWDVVTNRTYYSFAEMRPYLGPTVRIKKMTINLLGSYTYNPGHIAEMESISYLWRDGEIFISNERSHQTGAQDLQPILNSPTILQCRLLKMCNPYFLFKDYKVLYTVKIIEIDYNKEEIYPSSWLEFFGQPGAKPVVVLRELYRDSIESLLNHLSKAFLSSVSPNAYKIVFVQPLFNPCWDDVIPLIEFRETNSTSGEILELKKGCPAEIKRECLVHINTLERSRI